MLCMLLMLCMLYGLVTCFAAFQIRNVALSIMVSVGLAVSFDYSVRSFIQLVLLGEFI